MSISSQNLLNLRVVRECSECGAGPVGAHPAGGVWVCGACGGPVYGEGIGRVG